MRNGPDISLTAALIGDPARANMMAALMSGQALTATELAVEAGVTPQTASGHLLQLLNGGLLAFEKQGRHRYYRLASFEVATAIEALMDLAEHTSRRVRPGPKDPEMRRARVCYDHLAGEAGVELFARLSNQRIIALEEDGLVITPKGDNQLRAFGIDTSVFRTVKRPVCRTCLDWSERKWHLAGALGARLLERFFEVDWMRRVSGSRALRFTHLGGTEFERLFADGGNKLPAAHFWCVPLSQKDQPAPFQG